MEKIRVGVVGVGHLGNYHLQKYLKLPQCLVSGVADLCEERARTAASSCGCPAFADHRELLGKVDAVSIAVPTREHFRIARDFLARGVHVLVEKPITTALAEADELVSLASDRGVVFQVGMIERFNPAVRALAGLGIHPLFIEAHRLHSFMERGTDIDVILDLMIHELDIILTFVKAPIRTVEAVGVAVLSDKYDIANARLSFENGCIANVTASRLSGKRMQKIRFFEPGGYHSVDYQARELVSLKMITNSEGRKELTDNRREVEKYDPLEAEIRSFLEAVSGGTEPLVSGRAGRDALELALRISAEMKTIPKVSS